MRLLTIKHSEGTDSVNVDTLTGISYSSYSMNINGESNSESLVELSTPNKTYRFVTTPSVYNEIVNFINSKKESLEITALTPQVESVSEKKKIQLNECENKEHKCKCQEKSVEDMMEERRAQIKKEQNAQELEKWNNFLNYQRTGESRYLDGITAEEYTNFLATPVDITPYTRIGRLPILQELKDKIFAKGLSRKTFPEFLETLDTPSEYQLFKDFLSRI